VVSLFLAQTFAGPPYGHFIFPDQSSIVRGGVFIVSSVMIALLAGQLHEARSAALQERERYRITLRSIGDAVITTDRNGLITMINAEAERLTGWSVPDALGKPLKIVFRIINEESRRPVDDPVERVFQERRVVGLANHTLLISKDGRETPIEDSAAPITETDDPDVIWGVVLVFKDATQSRRAQLSLEAQARELETRVMDRTLHLQQALKDMETFSYSVAHDIRAPLKTLYTYVDVIREDYGSFLPKPALDHLERMELSAKRLDAITRDLLSFARVSSDSVAVKPLSLRDGVREALLGVPAAATSSVTVEIPDACNLVMGHDAVLQQVLRNLLENACKFVPPGTLPVISITARPEAHYVRLSVKDNGIGIKPEHQEKVFRIFERLNENTYTGTGLGLAIVARAMQKMQGRVGVDSKPGEGSTFWIDLIKASS
jgi:PAS domain S-box-containing protein